VQNSATQDYTVTYKGTEKWICTLARFSDSTFVFKTLFAGEKIILNNNSTRTFPESSTASVTARIQNGRLFILQENGSTISPFLGDWLFMLKNQFRVSFSGSSTTQNKVLSSLTLKYDYKLDKSKGW